MPGLRTWRRRSASIALVLSLLAATVLFVSSGIARSKPGPRTLSLSAADALVQYFQAAAAENPVYYKNDMEAEPAEWTSYTLLNADTWSVSGARTSSGTQSLHSQQPQTVYSQGSDSAIESPDIDLTGASQATLTFMHWWEFEVDAGLAKEGGRVEISTDGGSVWTPIDPVGGYPDTVNAIQDLLLRNPLHGAAVYGGTGGNGSELEPAIFDLTAYTGNVVRIRFHAAYNNLVTTEEGWYIDDVIVHSVDLGGLTATDNTLEDRVRLTWSGVTSSEFIYRVKRDGQLLSYLAAPLATYDDLSGDPDVVYNYCIELYTTQDNVLVYSACDDGSRILFAPDNMSASDSLHVDGVHVTWRDRSGIETGQVIYRDSVPIDTVAADLEAYVDTSAVAGVTYLYEVAATDGNGFESLRAADTGVRADVLPPANVQATDGEYTDRVKITWVDRSASEYAYVIFRDGLELMELPANTNSYVDSVGLSLGTAQTYCVMSIADAGRVGQSRMICDEGVGGDSTMTVPPNFAASDGAFDDKVEVTWSDPGTSEDEFLLYRDSVLIATLEANTTSFSDVDAVPGQTYSYAIVARSNNGGASQKVFDDGTRAEVLPPQNVVATDAEFENKVVLTWENEATTVVLFKVYRDSTFIATVPGNVLTFQDEEIASDTDYLYEVSALTALGSESARTGDIGSRKISRPTVVRATDNEYEDRVRVTWKDNSKIETGYRIYRQVQVCPGDSTVQTLVGEVGVNQTAFDDFEARSLRPRGSCDSLYTYCVAAYDPYGESLVTVLTCDIGSRELKAPLSVEATQGDFEDKIVLTWEDASRREDGYFVFRDCAGDCVEDPGNEPNLIARLGPNTYTYTDIIEGAYTYTVVAVDEINGADVSTSPLDSLSFSAQVSVNGNTALLPPQFVDASDIFGSIVALTWVDVSGKETGYEIRRGVLGFPGTEVLLDSTLADVTVYQDTTAVAGVEYEYCVRTVNALSTSDWVCSSGGIPAAAPDFSLNFPTTGDPACLGNQPVTAAGIGDFNGDGYPDIAIGDPEKDGPIGASRGRVRVYYGGPGADDVHDFQILGEDLGSTCYEHGEELGWEVGTAGDFNGDGYDDLLTDGFLGFSVYFGGAVPDNNADLIAFYNAFAMSGGGDLNGDGYDDLVAGDTGGDPDNIGDPTPGAAWIYLGGDTPDDNPDVVMTNNIPDEYYGNNVAILGDVNGDGFDDWAVSTWGDSLDKVYVYFGGAGLDTTADAILADPGEAPLNQFGDRLSRAGDLNGDGFDDFLVSDYAWGDNSEGRVYVYFGGSTIGPEPSITITGDPSSYLGLSMGPAGDFNNDGYDDFVVALGEDETGQNETYHPGPGQVNLYLGGPGVDGIPDKIFTGNPNDGIGWRVGAAGDFNNDGYDDLVVGNKDGWLGNPGTNSAEVYGGQPVDFAEKGNLVLEASDGEFNDRVQLRWTISSTVAPNVFVIYRDGEVIGQTDGFAKAYDDMEVDPGRVAEYKVEARVIDGPDLEGSDLGRRAPNGVISGRIANRAGIGVPGMDLSLDPSPGTALLFDGLSGHVRIPDPEFAIDGFTVEMWVRTNDPQSTLFHARSANSNVLMIRTGVFGAPAGDLFIDLPANPGIPGVHIADGQWHHLAVSWETADSTVSVFKDGVPAGSFAVTPGIILPTAERIVLGARQLDLGESLVGPVFQGEMDEVRVWNHKRADAEILAAYDQRLTGNETGLVGYWPLDQRQGPAAEDKSIHEHYARLYDGVVWTNSGAPLASGVTSDLEGNYSFSGLRYGAETSFKVRPTGVNREFQPAFKTITLNPQTPVQNEVDFTDVSSATLAGTVRYKGTNCFPEGIEIVVDGTPKGVTDKDGIFAVAVDLGAHTLEARKGNQTFNPASVDLNVTGDVGGLAFENTTTRVLQGSVRGGCDVSVGTVELLIKSENGCYEDVVTADPGFFKVLPPQRYFVSVQSVSNVPPPLDQAAVLEFFQTTGAKLVDLSAADSTLNLSYRAPLSVQVLGLTGDTCPLGPLGSDIPIIPQGQKRDLKIKVFEDYGNGNLCPVDTGSVTVFDEIIDEAGTPVTVPIHDGEAQYTTIANTPNVFTGRVDADGNNRDYQKSLTVVASVEDQTDAVATEWALVTGHRPRAATFTSLSEGIPLLILRDPPGDKSFSYVEEGQSFCSTISNLVMESVSGGASFQLKAGVSFLKGLGLMTKSKAQSTTEGKFEIGLEVQGNNAINVCATATERFSTSSLEEFVGDDSDVYLGMALNLIFALTDVIEVKDCVVVPSEAITMGADGVETSYLFTEAHIRDAVIPQLEKLAVSDPDKSSYYLSAKENWENHLALNDSLKNEATLIKNRSFSAGADLSYSETSTKTETRSWSTRAFASDETAIGAAWEESGNEGNLKYFVNLKASYTRAESETEGTQRTIGYTLSDNDPGDYFSVDVKEDPYFATPVFKLVSGTSSCPHETGGGTDVATWKTAPRDKALLAINPAAVTGLDPADAAEFTLTLTNDTQSVPKESRKYNLVLDPLSNTKGALVKFNGTQVTEDGIGITLPATGSVNGQITVERGPTQYNYQNMKLILEPWCESTEALSSDVAFSVTFDAPCSDISMVTPQQGWSADDSLTILLSDFEVEWQPGQEIHSVGAEFRAAGTSEWLPVKVCQDGGTPKIEFIPGTGPECNRIGTLQSLQIDWDTSALDEGAYDLRAYAACGGSGEVRVYSPVAGGRIDRTGPAVVSYTPADGVLSQGEQITITFNDAIDCEQITPANFTLTRLDSATTGTVSWTCDNDGLLVITPLVPTLAGMEGENLRMRVENVPDEAGNLSAPVEWDFEVRQAAFTWATTTVVGDVSSSSPDTFRVNLANGGNTDQWFRIENLPLWLDAEPDSGIIQGSEILEVTFRTVPAELPAIGMPANATVNAVAYDVATHSIADASTPVDFNLNVVCVPPAWDFDAADYQYTMTLIARVMIPDSTSTMEADDPNDVLVATVGNQTRGMASPQLVGGTDNLFFLTVHSNLAAGELVRFSFYDDSACRLWPAADTVFVFENDAIIGGLPPDDVTLNLRDTPGGNEQVIPVNAGWNWISFNRNPLGQGVLMPPVGILGDLNPAEGDQIKAQDGKFSQFDVDNGWVGTLSAQGSGLDNVSGYLLKISEPGTILLRGNPVILDNTPVPVDTSWNWIGYTPQTGQSVGTALAPVMPVSGDLIKSQTAFAEYDGTNWVGSLATMDPGTGYKLFLGAPPVSSFIYPVPTPPMLLAEGPAVLLSGTGSSRRGRLSALGAERMGSSREQIGSLTPGFAPPPIVLSSGPQWSVDYRAFQYNMTVTAVLSFEDARPVYEGQMVAALVGDEVRGVTHPVLVPGLDRYMVFLMIYGNGLDQESVTLKVYDPTDDRIMDATQTVNFQPDAIRGSVNEPFQVQVDPTTGERPAQFTFQLSRNHPNPFNAAIGTRIHYELAQKEHVLIQVFDITGRVVSTLVDQPQSEGAHEVTFSGEGLAGGIYFYRLRAGAFSDVQKMVILK